ncbi:uncharacterized protein LOC106071924 [Biomphalaria glabrata]|uniref:Uncharacterized protein LOC106071924 n=1 Tax=Biomphalaria glabrata TaxID=6526 RepID=A0A9W2Z7R9_BIOGL|nr:uncharacterized protein LOC106071924 [Biomphalaria glabrata]
MSWSFLLTTCMTLEMTEKLSHKTAVLIVTVVTYAVTTWCQESIATTKAPRQKAQLVKDYDYIDTGVGYGLNKLRDIAAPTNSGLPRSQGSSSKTDSITLGEKYEWLVDRLRSIKHRGSPEMMDELQRLFPELNITKVYNSLSPPLRQNYEQPRKAWRSNTSRLKEEDEMEGHWVNGTLQPGEGPERDDAYYYNGTWYPGVREVEDGHYVNGTWYPAPGEADEGHMVNGTWREEKEEEGKEEENETEELMWWQLHHPKWREGEKEAHHHKSTENEQQQQEKNSNSPNPIFAPVPMNIDTYTNQNLPRRPSSSPQYQRPQSQPFHQHSPNPQPRVQIPLVKDPAAPSFIENKPLQSKMMGNSGPEPLVQMERVPIHSKPNVDTVLKETSLIDTNLHKQYGMSSTMTWGIVIACFIAFTFILAPLGCILYKYRMEKRIKKRTFLKRPEHGSVDEGIMDAMVMSELGETNNSRIKMIGKKPSPRTARHDRSQQPNSRRGSSTSTISSRLRSERRPLTMMELGDGPEILIV